jgi:hypothetical protein
LVNLPLDERIPLLLQRVKGKLALVLQEPLQKMGMSFDEYLVEHKLLLDEPLSLE